MANLADGDLLEVAFVCSLGNQSGVGVRHFSVSDSAGGGITIEEAAAELSAQFGPLLQAVMATAARYHGLRIRVIKPVVTDVYVLAVNSANGSISGDPMPGQVCGLISLRSGLAGRSNRGRWYLPFPSETHNTSSAGVATAYYDAANDLADVYKDGVTKTVGARSAKMTGILYSRKENAVVAISHYITRLNWATQKRRSQLNRGDLPVTP